MTGLVVAPAHAKRPADQRADSASRKASAVAPVRAKAARAPVRQVAAKVSKVAKGPLRSAASVIALRAAQRPARVAEVDIAPPSFGQRIGLHAMTDTLDLKSSVALVVDEQTGEVLFSKNPQAVLPIASITKLMTALVVTEAALPLHEKLSVSQEDIDATTGSRSRLGLGTVLTRGEMLHLALMSSENRAAHVLGRTYPGGLQQFVTTMNRKARDLGMTDTRYVEPTGLSSDNQSSASDLARLVRAANTHPIIRELSTSVEAVMAIGSRTAQFHTTNGLVRSKDWEIGVQKTGYIAAAGRCLVMQAKLAGRSMILVLLDSAGKYSRIGDAERLRKWLSAGDSPLTASLPVSLPGVLPSALAAPVQPR